MSSSRQSLLMDFGPGNSSWLTRGITTKRAPPGVAPFQMTALPADLQREIIDYLLLPEYADDLLNLSCTCSVYRSALAPHVFKSLILVNDEKNSTSVELVASQRHYSQHVRELHYRASSHNFSVDELSDIEDVFPTSTKSVLSNLQRFPNLQTVKIEFPFHWAEVVEFDGLLEEDETPQEVLVAENTQDWRACMACAFDAFSQNATAHFETLELKNLFPKEVSTFRSDAWHHFLGTIQHIRLSVKEYDDAGDCPLNTQEAFWPFVANLGQYLFDHLRSTTAFVLEADENGPLGQRPGSSHVYLGLRPPQMPLLRSLELRSVFLNRLLVEALVTRLGILEELVLEHCLVVNTPGNSWHELFDTLAAAEPIKLRRLEVVSRGTTAIDYEFDDDIPGSEKEVAEARKVLAEDPNRWLFAYTGLDENGNFAEDRHSVRRCFIQGDDQRAYDRLMAIVERNAARADSGRSGGLHLTSGT